MSPLYIYLVNYIIYILYSGFYGYLVIYLFNLLIYKSFHENHFSKSLIRFGILVIG